MIAMNLLRKNSIITIVITAITFSIFTGLIMESSQAQNLTLAKYINKVKNSHDKEHQGHGKK